MRVVRKDNVATVRMVENSESKAEDLHTRTVN
jgi:hypothetical protein